MTRRAPLAIMLLSASLSRRNVIHWVTHLTPLLVPAALACWQVLARGDLPAWVEVRSPHFLVVSDAGEEQARQVAFQSEEIRSALCTALPRLRLDPPGPVILLYLRDPATARALLPANAEPRGRREPEGAFQRGEYRNYLVVSAGTRGENPRQVHYHEYFHLVAALNFRNVPIWLSEGLAEFYGNTAITGNDARIGNLNRGQLDRVRTHGLIPLEEVFTAGRDSPHYQDSEKAALFYSQSWTLVHYLLLAERGAHAERLWRLLELLAQGVPSLEAHRRALGDFRSLEARLRSYLRRSEFPSLSLKFEMAPTPAAYSSRALSAAESAAVRGDFLLHAARLDEARALLEEAARLDSQLAAAHESLGLLYLREENENEASARFARAIELGSSNPLAHYYYAVLTARSAKDPASLATAEFHLQRTIQIEPAFARAYAALSGLHLLRQESDEALRMARRAVELEPRQLFYQLDVARILMRVGQTDEARAIGSRVLNAATRETDRKPAAAFLEDLEQLEHAKAEIALLEEQLRERESRRAVAEPSFDQPAEPRWKKPDVSRLPAQAYAWGTVKVVSCSAPARMQVTLEWAEERLTLRALNYRIVAYYVTTGSPPKSFDPCTQLQGLYAGFVYRPVRNQPHDGEILAIELRAAPGAPR